jgi:bacterioferritin
MQGDLEVVEFLNEVLSAELTGINQYFIHAMICANRGYGRLAQHSRQESIEEMKHAQEVIERILFLEGVAQMDRYMRINVGQTVPEQHRNDLALERDAVARLRAGIDLVRRKGDEGTRLLLEKVLADEEEHVDWLEAQLQQIEDVGLPNYLARQIEG